MNTLSKSIACFIALTFIPLPKATAGEWSYGIKGGLGTSFSTLTAINQHTNSGLGITMEVKQEPKKWNPWFSGALYIEYTFNDYIGLGAELLYHRFISACRKVMSFSSVRYQDATFFENKDAIGLPVLLSLHWTAFIGPGFKEDYFLGRIFAGIYPFYFIRQEVMSKYEINGQVSHHTTSTKLLDQKWPELAFIAGASLEWDNGCLLEGKSVFYKKNKSFHLSVGYNFARLST